MKINKPEREDIRKGLSWILLNKDYSTVSLADRIGISHTDLCSFLQNEPINDDAKIRKFVINYSMFGKQQGN